MAERLAYVIVDLARPIRLARACSYATRNFAAQVRGRDFTDAVPGPSARRPRTQVAAISILMAPDEPTPAMKNPEKDPEEWSTGQEPMTGPQRSYLQTLCREAGEEFNDKLTKAEASKKIEELQTKTGRGKK
jgi:hypothetical protein